MLSAIPHLSPMVARFRSRMGWSIARRSDLSGAIALSLPKLGVSGMSGEYIGGECADLSETLSSLVFCDSEVDGRDVDIVFCDSAGSAREVERDGSPTTLRAVSPALVTATTAPLAHNTVPGGVESTMPRPAVFTSCQSSISTKGSFVCLT